jgi:hypothetical protein
VNLCQHARYIERAELTSGTTIFEASWRIYITLQIQLRVQGVINQQCDLRESPCHPQLEVEKIRRRVRAQDGIVIDAFEIQLRKRTWIVAKCCAATSKLYGASRFRVERELSMQQRRVALGVNRKGGGELI